MTHHLAQVNVMLARGPIDSDTMAGFVAELDPINALADAAPGFVWRLQDDDGNATAIRPFDDELMMINLSVWESTEALWNFVYASRHLDVLRRRKQWAHRLDEAITALWWVPEGHRPDVTEAKERLDLLRSAGPSPRAFTFKQLYVAETGDLVP